ncbi:helix-turn-helix transcriptional regulator [Labrys miyagiensis]|uniref:Helix-turn-helix transcriptional regulator n=2 Tax=Labrys miyagiensis TaxID=346912 RepID=A0ABQ6CBJ7_9HYPH|nr:helix-turn-helix transcriptional regulator [Labrys miyagiensis]
MRANLEEANRDIVQEAYQRDLPAHDVPGRNDDSDALAAATDASDFRGEDFERLAIAAGLSGREDDYLKAFEKAHNCYQSNNQTIAAARTAFWIGFRLSWQGQVSRANGWLARAQRLVERAGDDCPERGYLLLPAVQRHLALNENRSAGSLAAAAASIGDRFRDNDLGVYARTLQGRALLADDEVAAGLALLDEAMVAVVAGELTPMFTGLVYCTAIANYHRMFAFDRAREWTSAFDDWCKSQPQVAVFSSQCLLHRAEILHLSGQWPEAMDIAKRLERGGTSKPAMLVRAAAHYQRAEIHRLRGEFRCAELAYREAEHLGSNLQPGLALLRLAQGKAREALACLRREVDACHAGQGRLRLLPALAEILVRLGKHEEARHVADELIEIAIRMGTEAPMALALQSSGMIRVAEGDAQAGLAKLGKALALWQSVGVPYEAARTRVAMGYANLALGEQAGARLAFDQALTTFRHLRAMPDIELLLAVPRVSAPKACCHLTTREIEVLRLVANGKTNRSISTELGLSVRTIDRHLANIFIKLDVPSRAAATAYAYEHNLF